MGKRKTIRIITILVIPRKMAVGTVPLSGRWDLSDFLGKFSLSKSWIKCWFGWLNSTSSADCGSPAMMMASGPSSLASSKLQRKINFSFVKIGILNFRCQISRQNERSSVLVSFNENKVWRIFLDFFRGSEVQIFYKNLVKVKEILDYCLAWM